MAVMLKGSLPGIWWLLFCTLAVGQQATNTQVSVADTVYCSSHLTGIVTEQKGAPIPNAKVQIRKAGIGVADANTDHNGTFSFEKLNPGEYELAVQAFAFKSIRYHVVAVKELGKKEEPLQIKMQLAPLSHNVEVAPSKK